MNTSNPRDEALERPAPDETNDSGSPTREDAAAAAVPEARDDAGDARKQRDDYYDRLLRTTAEFDNYRKRVERERRELAEFAAAELLTDLLPLVDDLDRALTAAPQAEANAAVAAYRAGVELIHRQLLELLRKRGVKPIEALGADFDPRLHQAVATEVSGSYRDGEIIEELRRGYKLGDRLLRPAMVKVAARE